MRGGWLAVAVIPCAAVTVLLGVLLMHSVPLVHPPGGHDMTGASTIVAVTTPGSAVMAELGCSTDCSTHPGMAMCMAVITVATALVVLRRLLAHQSSETMTHSWMPRMGRHASRAPPWAAPSLEKLSVLRI